MTHLLLPAIWLIVFIVGIPQLSETVYTPSLPDIAEALSVSDSMVEYTLTIYLFSFALGTLFWGVISDRLGRKPCIIYGLVIFIIGCVICYYAHTIEILMMGRFIQAFGGSIGSVLGQAVCRDSFHGADLGKVYSTVGSSLALFPAIGPVVGGVIAEIYGWQSIFLFLVLVTICLTILVYIKLPETYKSTNKSMISILEVLITMILDKKVIGFGIIVAACNGIAFSYFAEGSFYLIQNLGLTPSEYGLSFIAIACATAIGGFVSRILQVNYESQLIIGYGLYVIIISTLLLTIFVVIDHYFIKLPGYIIIFTTILSQMITMFGICMTTSNALAIALIKYKHCIGTASSIFGFFYYCLIAFFTFGMGILHDGTLRPMPLYFLSLSILMLVVKRIMICRN